MINKTIITRNLAMQSLLMEAEVVSKSDCPVLIIGETGSGKEIFSDYIYSKSLRKNKKFVKVSLSSLPDNLFESEFFGHERGSYTGAYKSQIGFFEAANQGTIFLDDIDDFPIHLQSKLLRVIENKEVIRIGSNTPVNVDVRIISSSKVELQNLIEKGYFRSDLFYRLSVFRIYIPPLRDRKEDIPLLLDHFINQIKHTENNKIQLNKINLTPLIEYDWKGNVRELRNFAEKLILYSEEELKNNFNSIFDNFINGNLTFKNIRDDSVENSSDENNNTDSFKNMVKKYEINLINEAFKKSYGNINLASRILLMKTSTLRDKIIKYNIDPNKYKKY